jgi:hypothetical protein
MARHVAAPNAGSAPGGRIKWEDWIARGLDDFAERHLRGAVRRHPDVAISILREEGKI